MLLFLPDPASSVGGETETQRENPVTSLNLNWLQLGRVEFLNVPNKAKASYISESYFWCQNITICFCTDLFMLTVNHSQALHLRLGVSHLYCMSHFAHFLSLFFVCFFFGVNLKEMIGGRIQTSVDDK